MCIAISGGYLANNPGEVGATTWDTVRNGESFDSFSGLAYRMFQSPLLGGPGFVLSQLGLLPAPQDVQPLFGNQQAFLTGYRDVGNAWESATITAIEIYATGGLSRVATRLLGPMACGRLASFGLGAGIGMGTNALAQGVQIALGLQDNFSVTQMLSSGLLNGFSQSLNRACFSGDTLLRARGSWGKGWRRIDQITLDDEVLSRAEGDPTGPVQWKKVEELFNRTGRLGRLRVAGHEIRTTLEHPFYEYTKGWVPASELRAGDLLATEDSRWVTVEEVEDEGAWETVYNLHVAEYHTYFVGGEDWGYSVWAHNTYALSPTPAKPSVYSAAFETRLTGSQLGLRRAQHFQIANQALQAERAANPALAALVPAPVGWGRAPAGWTWQHATIAQGGGQAGVLQLVPRSQHASGSAFWSLFHPLPGSGGGICTMGSSGREHLIRRNDDVRN